MLSSVVVAAAWYWRGSRRSRLRAVSTRRRDVPWRGLSFAAALVTIVVALDSPLERAAETFFWAHMLQHVLLMTIAAPLVVVGAPWLRCWRPFPLGFRRTVARMVVKSPRLGWLRRSAALIAAPLPAWLLFNVDLGVWHVPYLYDLTLRNSPVHYLEHVLFIVFGLLFWVQVIGSPPFRPRLGYFGRAVYTTAGSFAGWLLAIVLAVAPAALYPAYAEHAGRSGGLSAFSDQQLAAGVMLGAGSIPYAIVVFSCLYVWLGEEETPRRRGVRRPAARGEAA